MPEQTVQLITIKRTTTDAASEMVHDKIDPRYEKPYLHANLILMAKQRITYFGYDAVSYVILLWTNINRDRENFKHAYVT